jgi:serine/threonine protein kinase
LFDFGVADNGAFYYAMELLEGLDTDALVRRFGPMSAERALYLLGQVCHSLSEAHARGLVHRDIKPANVFVCRYGEDWDFVKVLDFGIVKESRRADGDPSHTRDHAFQGTPAFAAPEQAEGKADIDGRADIYAVGCLAYWLMTGQHVFSADTPMALLMAHVGTTATPPSSRCELPIPAALDDIVLACLAKSPDHRPQSARELANRLSDVAGVSPWTEDQAQAWWSSHAPAEANA